MTRKKFLEHRDFILRVPCADGNVALLQAILLLVELVFDGQQQRGSQVDVEA